MTRETAEIKGEEIRKRLFFAEPKPIPVAAELPRRSE
jgi:hypothetical protein